MKKKSTKRFNKEIISKDFTIGFYAGIGGAGTFWFLQYFIQAILDNEWDKVAISFIIYILVGITTWIILRAILIRTYGKK